MLCLSIVGVGMGALQHLTRQGEAVLRRADAVLLPHKGEEKAALAQARQALVDALRPEHPPKWLHYSVPQRMPQHDDRAYVHEVHIWHDAIARAWADVLASTMPHGGHVALPVWGDPCLYDSSLRIARRVSAWLSVPLHIDVIPGVTAVQALTAAHAVTLNDIAEPVVITTGRRLRSHGWPTGATSVVVMLDGATAFECLDPKGLSIWWGAYLGWPMQALDAGPLADAGPRIAQRRRELRQQHGWILDTYLLRRKMPTAAGE